MARTWLQVKVELRSGMGAELEPAPGRVFAVGPSTTFARFADAINRAFGRWDFSHLHLFELADGTTIGFPDDGFGLNDWTDHTQVKLGSAVRPGDSFEFVFDLGDAWRHRCSVLAEKLDPSETFGESPREPVILWGWGWLPDQYGREDEDEEE